MAARHDDDRTHSPREETDGEYGLSVDEGVDAGRFSVRPFDWRQARMLKSRHGVGVARACICWPWETGWRSSTPGFLHARPERFSCP